MKIYTIRMIYIRFFLICLLFVMSVIPVMSQHLLIAYHSETGHTEQMAQAVAEGARSVEGVTVWVRKTDEVTEKELLEVDGIIVGSPVYNANVSPEISRFMASWPFEGEPLKNKIGAAFVTGGGISAGEEIVQMNILQSMMVFGMIVTGGPEWTQPFGASAITGEKPFNSEVVGEPFLIKGRNLGYRVAEIARMVTADGK